MNFQNIDIAKVKQLIQEENALVVDIRDPQSFAAGHIPGAIRVDSTNVDDFIRQADLDRPLVVVCYHGHSSQGAAQYFANMGFDSVYSLIGGMTQWALTEPVEQGETS